jgi:SAM-dependent MidA family methyltransferase
MAKDSQRWLQDLIAERGGRAPFPLVMDWLLNDPHYGFYGSGRCCFGPRGDFVTAPSLGSALADLLLKQLLPCFDQLSSQPGALSLIEWGPGNGLLAQQFQTALIAANPPWLDRLEMQLVESSEPLRKIQQEALQHSLIPCYWPTPVQLVANPKRGVVVAHELLDALPVERFVLHKSTWHGFDVVLGNHSNLEWQIGAPLSPQTLNQLAALGLGFDGAGRPDGWRSEWCSSLEPWLRQARQGLREGWLLAIDYGHPAERYYCPSRDGGTLLAYRAQRASADLLDEPGSWDITAHVCTTLMQQLAVPTDWHWQGAEMQGEALLRLGLAERWSCLSNPGPEPLTWRLARREEYQRLVDPYQLGGFWWLELCTPGLEAMGQLARDQS